MSEYWKNYWKNSEITGREHLQMQVGRTINRNPVSEELWNKTVEHVESFVKPTKKEIILDLCSGNGLLAMPLSTKCREVIAVDISDNLLSKIDHEKYANISTLKSDALEIQFPENSLDKAVLYFALQHFNLKETLLLLELVYRYLKKDGVFYIGDIPEAEKRFLFFNTPDREKAYFDSIQKDVPIVGQWFSRSFIEKAAVNIGFTRAKTVDQPLWQINAHYRFDAILIK